MERNIGQGYHAGMPDGQGFIPFKILATCGPGARARADERAKAGVSPEQHLERFMPTAETALAELVYQESMNHGVRTLTHGEYECRRSDRHHGRRRAQHHVAHRNG